MPLPERKDEHGDMDVRDMLGFQIIAVIRREFYKIFLKYIMLNSPPPVILGRYANAVIS